VISVRKNRGFGEAMKIKGKEKRAFILETFCETSQVLKTWLV
jgi:hypothetical protein